MRAACYPHPLCSILVTLTARELKSLSGTCWRSTSRLSYRLPWWLRISGVAPGVHTLQVDWTNPSSAIPCHHVESGVIRASVPAWCDGRGAPAEGRCVDQCGQVGWVVPHLTGLSSRCVIKSFQPGLCFLGGFVVWRFVVLTGACSLVLLYIFYDWGQEGNLIQLTSTVTRNTDDYKLSFITNTDCCMMHVSWVSLS